MRKRDTSLETGSWTSMIDIIFQLMIFFLVTLNILPAVKSAEQVEGNLSISTPRSGDANCTHLVQIIKNPMNPSQYGYLVLDGSPQAAEFAKDLERNKAFLANATAIAAEVTYATNNGLWFDEQGLAAKFKEAIMLQDVTVIISGAKNLPYGEIVKVHALLYELGISKIAWLDASLADLKLNIQEKR
jgi:biopolymer transport protein ExbD